MPKFKTRIVLPSKYPPKRGEVIEATIEARNTSEARKLFVAQYGKDAVRSTISKA